VLQRACDRGAGTVPLRAAETRSTEHRSSLLTSRPALYCGKFAGYLRAAEQGSRGAGSLTHGKPARSALVSTAQLPFFSISTAVTSVEMAAGTALCVRVAAASKAAAWITAKQRVGPHQAPGLTSAPLHAPAGSAAHPNTHAVSSAPASPLKLPVPCFSEALAVGALITSALARSGVRGFSVPIEPSLIPG